MDWLDINPDLTTITFILRLIVVALMFWCAPECWRTTKLIANNRLKPIVKKIAVGVFGFALGRLIATFFDNHIDFGIGVFSNVVNYAFWFWILFYLRKNRQRVESDSIGAAGRQRLSDAIDEIITEMKLERDKIKSVQ